MRSPERLIVVFCLLVLGLTVQSEERSWDRRFSDAQKAMNQVKLEGVEAELAQLVKEANAFPAGDPRKYKCRVQLARALSMQGGFARAEPLLKEALKMAEASLGKERPGLVRILDALAMLFKQTGRLREAESHLKRALAILEKGAGAGDATVALLLQRLAEVLMDQGRLREAETLARRASELAKTKLKESDPRRADVATGLGMILQQQGKLSEALPLFRESVSLREKGLRKGHPLIAQSLTNVAGILLDLDRAKEAEPLLRRALRIFEAATGSDHPHLEFILMPLARACRFQDRSKEALTLAERVLRIQSTRLGPDHPNTVFTLNLMAGIHADLGKLDRVEKLLQRGLKTAEGRLGPGHPLIGMCLNNLVALYREQKAYAKALPLADRAHAIQREAFGEFASSTIACRKERACLLLGLDRDREALAEFADIRRQETVATERVFPISSEHQKLLWKQRGRATTAMIIELALKQQGAVPQAVQWALDACLAHKGAVTEAQAVEMEIAFGRGGPELARLAKDLVEARREAARLALRGRQDEAQRAARDRATQLEEQLAGKSAPYAARRAQRKAMRKSVIASIPDKSAFVTYIRCLDFDRESVKWKGFRFSAVVIKHGGRPHLIDLGPAKAIEDAVDGLRKAISRPMPSEKGEQASENLSAVHKRSVRVAELVLRPLWPHLKDVPRWILSPDGRLLVLPFSILPSPDSNEFVIDRYQIEYVTSGRSLVGRFEAKKPSRDVLILADPDFNLSLASRKSGPARKRSSDPVDVPGGWKRLPGTREEGDALAALLRKHGRALTLKTGKEATRSALFSARRPRFIHLATHGFYLADQEQPEPSQLTRGLAGIVSAKPIHPGARLAGLARENPLLRSGLVFAGVNGKGGLLEGVATAQELTGLDLWGTELVVLSACETGLGEVTSGEGVSGLRRAFLLSGARNVISSLWKVPDRETKALMLDFYRALLDGKAPAAALRDAKLNCKARVLERMGSAHPWFWGGFIVTGKPE